MLIWPAIFCAQDKVQQNTRSKMNFTENTKLKTPISFRRNHHLAQSGFSFLSSSHGRRGDGALLHLCWQEPSLKAMQSLIQLCQMLLSQPRLHVCFTGSVDLTLHQLPKHQVIKTAFVGLNTQFWVLPDPVHYTHFQSSNTQSLPK